MQRIIALVIMQAELIHLQQRLIGVVSAMTTAAADVPHVCQWQQDDRGLAISSGLLYCHPQHE